MCETERKTRGIVDCRAVGTRLGYSMGVAREMARLAGVAIRSSVAQPIAVAISRPYT